MFFYSISSPGNTFGKTGSLFDRIPFTTGRIWSPMVKSIFISIKFTQKYVRQSFGILKERCTLHRRYSTLWVTFTRTSITFYSFRVTGATTSQNEGLPEIHNYYANKPQLDCFIPKKRTLNGFSGLRSFSARFLCWGMLLVIRAP